jgi:uncharacterized protein (DUF58 family)
LVVCVSDLIAPLEDTLAALRRFRYDGHAAVLAHVVDAAEEDFPFDGRLQFEGLETAERLRTDARQIRPAYLASFNRFTEDLQRGCLESGVDYLRIRTDERLDTTLARFLSAPSTIG